MNLNLPSEKNCEVIKYLLPLKTNQQPPPANYPPSPSLGFCPNCGGTPVELGLSQRTIEENVITGDVPRRIIPGKRKFGDI